MRYTAEHKEETRKRILAAVSRGFRERGFGGIGVDGLAQFAQLTSGAFYSSFRSKSEAFHSALLQGLEEIRAAVEAYRETHGTRWVKEFAEFYFTDRVTCELADGCTLPSLSGDAARGDGRTREVFEQGYLALVEAIATGLPGRGEARFARALLVTVLFTGGVTLARAVKDQKLRDRIARAARDAVVEAARG